MTDSMSNSVAPGNRAASRAEIDALSAVIAATIAMAARTRSVGATALLERALEMLDDRIRDMGLPADDAPRGSFRPS